MAGKNQIETHHGALVRFYGDFVAISGGETHFVFTKKEAARIAAEIQNWLEKKR